MSANVPLRPLERRIVRLVDDGVDTTEIARRFRRSPEFVERVLDYSRLPGRTGRRPPAQGLRPVERRVLKWETGGAAPADIAPRFRRSPAHIQRVEQLARYKLQAH